MKNEYIKLVITTFVISIIVLSIFIMYKKNIPKVILERFVKTEEIVKVQEPHDIKIEIAEKTGKRVEDVQTFQINEDYVTFYIENEEIEPVIYNTKEKLVSTIEDLIKDKDKLKEIIKEQTEIKYPKFISKELNNPETKIKYTFLEDGVEIKFSNYKTTPIYEEKTSIKLTCEMIENIIDYNCSAISETNPNVIIIDKTKKVVALTFDDGPNNNTKRVLEILDDNKATATFFMLGTNMKNFSKIVKTVSETDNEIASHTNSHKDLTKLSESELNFEINNNYSILKNITDTKINLVRPPYGNINKNVKNHIDKPIILWSLDSEDWLIRDGEKIKDKVLEEIKDGDIILMHDIHKTTGDAIELLLPELYIKGYQVVTVTKLAEIKNITLNSNTTYRQLR